MASSPNYYGGPTGPSHFRPERSNEERLVDEALEAALAPDALLAGLRPPLPQVRLFPPRTGYGDLAQRTITIDGIWNVGRYIPDNGGAMSGGPGSYSGTQRPGLDIDSLGPNPF